VTLCPSKPPTVNPQFSTDLNCNRNTPFSCFLHQLTQECAFFVKCCYLNIGYNNFLISKYAKNSGLRNNRSFLSIKNFIGDILPRIICCVKSSNPRSFCDLFQKTRKVNNNNNSNFKKSTLSSSSTPSTLTSKVGICYGDPHFLTFDEQVMEM